MLLPQEALVEDAHAESLEEEEEAGAQQGSARQAVAGCSDVPGSACLSSLPDLRAPITAFTKLTNGTGEVTDGTHGTTGANGVAVAPPTVTNGVAVAPPVQQEASSSLTVARAEGRHFLRPPSIRPTRWGAGRGA